MPNIAQVVINCDAQEQLALCTGISPVIIANVLDFENPPSLSPTDDGRFYRLTTAAPLAPGFWSPPTFATLG